MSNSILNDPHSSALPFGTSNPRSLLASRIRSTFGRSAALSTATFPENRARQEYASESVVFRTVSAPHSLEQRTSRHAPLSPQLRVLSKDSERITLHNIIAAIFDVDETLVANTGHKLHDGPDGRFSFIYREEYKHHTGNDPRISDDEWHGEEYMGSLAGKSELAICTELADKLSAKISNSLQQNVQVRAQDLALRLKNYFANEEIRERKLKEIELVPFVKDLLGRIDAANVTIAACTASGAHVVDYVASHFGLHHYIPPERFQYSAIKRADSRHDYRGRDVDNARRKTSVRYASEDPETPRSAHPRQTVMFGDSANDVFSAAAAGIPVVVIRPPVRQDASDDEFATAVTKLTRSIEKTVAANWKRREGTQREGAERTYRTGPEAVQIIIVRSFDQVLIGQRPDSRPVLADDRISMLHELIVEYPKLDNRGGLFNSGDAPCISN